MEKNVVLKTTEGDILYPKTKASIVINNNGENLGDVAPRAEENKIDSIQVNSTPLDINNKVVNILLPEYNLNKAETPDNGYSATYILTKDGTPIGDKINIAKDMVVQSGSVKVCTEANTPVAGYKIGDKYIDLLLANAEDQHVFVLVSDLVDTYTPGNGIKIEGNTISLDVSALNGQFLTEHQDISGKADKATTLNGYGITDGVTYEVL